MSRARPSNIISPSALLSAMVWGAGGLSLLEISSERVEKRFRRIGFSRSSLSEQCRWVSVEGIGFGEICGTSGDRKQVGEEKEHYLGPFPRSPLWAFSARATGTARPKIYSKEPCERPAGIDFPCSYPSRQRDRRSWSARNSGNPCGSSRALRPRLCKRSLRRLRILPCRSGLGG